MDSAKSSKRFKSMDWNKCVFQDCNSVHGQKDHSGEDIHFYSFPKDANDNSHQKERMQIWLDHSGNPELGETYSASYLGKQKAVCYKHFHPKDIDENKQLKKNSNPFPYNLIPKRGTAELMQDDNRVIPMELDSDLENLNESIDSCSLAPIENGSSFTIKELTSYFRSNPIRESWSWTAGSDNLLLTFIDSTMSIKCLVAINHDSQGDLVAEAYFKREISGPIDFKLAEKIYRLENFIEFQKHIEKTKICRGVECQPATCTRAENCEPVIPENDVAYKDFNKQYCQACKSRRKNITDVERRKEKKNVEVESIEDLKRKIKNYKAQVERAAKSREDLNTKLKNALQEISELEKDSISGKIELLPINQQLVVRTCLEFAGVNPRQRRYSSEWLCICILMRNLNARLYDRMRSMELLPLPTRVTLTKNIQNVGDTYGFQDTVFHCMKYQAPTMTQAEKRGAVLIDEMSISPSVTFNRMTFEFEGFVNFGEHTLKEDRSKIADHALVMMYQPFRGQWVQCIGSFLSHGAANAKILKKLLFEGIVHLGNAGFITNVVAADGGQWNRGVWTDCKITEDSLSCPNPYQKKFREEWEKEERVWFISDFAHLMKCFRNKSMEEQEFKTPDGVVKRAHWEALLEYEKWTKPNLKMAPKLTLDHIYPKNWQKMRVPLCYQLYDSDVAAAMEILRNISLNEEPGKYSKLEDSSPTIILIRRMRALIIAMKSNSSADALKNEASCEKTQAIQSVIDWLKAWRAMYPGKKSFPGITASTNNGIMISLKAALEVAKFLFKHEYYEFVMTERFSTNRLELHFSIVRGATGGNDHPDAKIFSQTMRIITTRRLLQPPKGCNIESTEMLEEIAKYNKPTQKIKEAKNATLQRINNLFEQNLQDKSVMDLDKSDDNVEDLRNEVEYEDYENNHIYASFNHHDYDYKTTNPMVTSYIAGSIVRKPDRFSKCSECLSKLSLDWDEKNQRHQFIKLMDRGNLTYPSGELENLMDCLEEQTLLAISSMEGVTFDTFFKIVGALELRKNTEKIPTVGCESHRADLSAKITKYFLIRRMDFICDNFNRHLETKRKGLSKLSKQNVSSDKTYDKTNEWAESF